LLAADRCIARRGVSGGKTYGREAKRVDLDTEGSHVLLLELTRHMALDEGGLRKKKLRVSMMPLIKQRGSSAREHSAADHDEGMRIICAGVDLPCQCHHHQQGRA